MHSNPFHCLFGRVLNVVSTRLLNFTTLIVILGCVRCERPKSTITQTADPVRQQPPDADVSPKDTTLEGVWQSAPTKRKLDAVRRGQSVQFLVRTDGLFGNWYEPGQIRFALDRADHEEKNWFVTDHWRPLHTKAGTDRLPASCTTLVTHTKGERLTAQWIDQDTLEVQMVNAKALIHRPTPGTDADTTCDPPKEMGVFTIRLQRVPNENREYF